MKGTVFAKPSKPHLFGSSVEFHLNLCSNFYQRLNVCVIVAAFARGLYLRFVCSLLARMVWGRSRPQVVLSIIQKKKTNIQTWECSAEITASLCARKTEFEPKENKLLQSSSSLSFFFFFELVLLFMGLVTS